MFSWLKSPPTKPDEYGEGLADLIDETRRANEATREAMDQAELARQRVEKYLRDRDLLGGELIPRGQDVAND